MSDLLLVIQILLVIFFAFVLLELSYTASMAIKARRGPIEPGGVADSDAVLRVYTVFLVPCLNEEKVIGRCIQQLLLTASDNVAIVVIDDGSSDGTAEVVRLHEGERVRLLQRRPPDCQNGKGEALNAGLEYVRKEITPTVGDKNLVVCVVDADGSVSPDILAVSSGLFVDGRYSAAQILVRMYNRADSLLARMQDFEFAVNGGLYQRARQKLGCPALGGNGQFTSLAALERLEGVPWSSCLVEDLELSIRMTVSGDRVAYEDMTHVEQQGLQSIRKLIRQRSRWFQGKLQCWRWVRSIRKSPFLRRRQKIDMIHDLYGSFIILQSSFMTVLFAGLLTGWLIIDSSNLVDFYTSWYCLPLIVLYLLMFGMTPLYASIYSKTDDDVGFFKAWALAHLYVLYEYHWMPAGWIGTWRHIRHKSSWLKTERIG